MPVRIYDIAKKLGIESKQVLVVAKELGIKEAKVPSSQLDKITAEFLVEKLGALKPADLPPVVEAPVPVPTPEAAPSATDPAAPMLVESAAVSVDGVKERLLALRKRFTHVAEWRRACVGFAARCAWRVFPLCGDHRRQVEPALLVASLSSIGAGTHFEDVKAAAAYAAAAYADAAYAAYAAAAAAAADDAAAAASADAADAASDDADDDAAAANAANAADLVALETEETIVFDGRRWFTRPLWPGRRPRWATRSVFGDRGIQSRYDGFLRGEVDWAACMAAFKQWVATRAGEGSETSESVTPPPDEPVPPATGEPSEEKQTLSRPTPETPAAPPPPTSAPPRKTIERPDWGNHGTGGHATGKDQLNFTPLVEGVRNFLAADKTQAPFTLSVEAEWGMGKSSFLLQLKEKLGRDAVTVTFNPWRHDAGESMWAAFAVALTEALQPKGWLARHWAALRYRWNTGELGGWWKVVVLVTVAVAWLFCGRWLTPKVLAFAFDLALQDDKQMEGLMDFVKWAVVTGFHLGILFLLFRTTWNKLGLDALQEVRAMTNASDYASRVSAIERLQRNFGHLVRAYAPKAKKIYVFVDDLDRCAAPKAGELLESLALLMSGEDDKPEGERLPLIFILALDREKVAAGVAVKHANVLPYLQAGRETKLSLEEMGIRFGYEYLEKFIHVPFRLPKAHGAALHKFIHALAPRDEKLAQPAGRPVPQTEKAPPEQSELKPAGPTSPMEPTQRAKGSASAKPELVEEEEKPSEPTAKEVTAAAEVLEQAVDGSGLLQNALKLAAPCLGHNPRRIKHYQNLLRLQLHIGWQLGVRSEGPVTPTQLAKLVMIEIARPTLYRALAEHAKKREEFLDWSLETLPYWMKQGEAEVPEFASFAKDDDEWLQRYWPDIHFTPLSNQEGEKAELDPKSLEWLLHLGAVSVVEAEEPSKSSPK